MRDGIRRVTHVTEIVGMEGDVVTMQDLFTFDYQGENRDGTLLGAFTPRPSARISSSAPPISASTGP